MISVETTCWFLSLFKTCQKFPMGLRLLTRFTDLWPWLSLCHTLCLSHAILLHAWQFLSFLKVFLFFFLEEEKFICSWLQRFSPWSLWPSNSIALGLRWGRTSWHKDTVKKAVSSWQPGNREIRCRCSLRIFVLFIPSAGMLFLLLISWQLYLSFNVSSSGIL